MSDDHIEGTIKQGLGHLQDGAGGLTGDDNIQAKSKLNEATGSIQKTFGQVKEQAQAAFGDATEQARGAYEGVAGQLKDKPLMAVGIGMGLGLVAGLLLRGDKKTLSVPQ